MSIRIRLRQLARHLPSPVFAWFSLTTWRRETDAGVDLAEQERHVLAEYPASAAEIQASFATRRARLAEVAELEGNEG